MKALLRVACILLLARVISAQQDYLTVGVLLDQFIEREMREKGLNGVAVALVDDQKIVFSRGYGVARPDKIDRDEGTPLSGPSMTPSTGIRAGSVSKLFTSILVMREVEAGRLDLDAPITKYVPSFHPTNRFNKPITLREILAHRSGIVREPPYGNYFETNQTSLSRTVESLNETDIVYEPGERPKYSNAALTLAGYIAAQSAQKQFTTLARKGIFEPIGMRDSSFNVFEQEIATGTMWTLHGTKFRAPIFELGISPAGSLTTTVLDLGKFASALIADADGANKLLRKETLQSMWKSAYTNADNRGFGIGFFISQFEGHRQVGHNGAVYGFSTSFNLLPDEKLGAIVVVTHDSANTIASPISTIALQSMLRVREGEPLQIPAATQPISHDLARAWEGKFAAGEKQVELINFNGQLHLFRRGVPEPLGYDGTNFTTDGLLAHGTKVELSETTNQLQLASDTYYRQPQPLPASMRPDLLPLIGEYGWDHDVLYIMEKDGKLWCLIEWFEFAPLDELAPDVFRFPDYGSYAGEKLVFKRGSKNKITEVNAGNVRFKRRKAGPEDGVGQARLHPLKPIPALMKQAATELPPRENGDFKKQDLIEVASLDPTITLEIRYATTNNFLSSIFYPEPRAFMQRPAAEALARVHATLRERGYGLRVFDAYRPWAVTKVFWDATTEAQHEFVADPSKGSRHNRGCAVDLTLYDLSSGASIEMPGTYDETTDRSYPSYPGGTSRQRWHRDLLRHVMESEGFRVYKTEWWHFDYEGWPAYPILNVPFSALK